MVKQRRLYDYQARMAHWADCTTLEMCTPLVIRRTVSDRKVAVMVLKALCMMFLLSILGVSVKIMCSTILPLEGNGNTHLTNITQSASMQGEFGLRVDQSFWLSCPASL